MYVCVFVHATVCKQINACLIYRLEFPHCPPILIQCLYSSFCSIAKRRHSTLYPHDIWRTRTVWLQSSTSWVVVPYPQLRPDPPHGQRPKEWGETVDLNAAPLVFRFATSTTSPTNMSVRLFVSLPWMCLFNHTHLRRVRFCAAEDRVHFITQPRRVLLTDLLLLNL